MFERVLNTLLGCTVAAWNNYHIFERLEADGSYLLSHFDMPDGVWNLPQLEITDTHKNNVNEML